MNYDENDDEPKKQLRCACFEILNKHELGLGGQWDPEYYRVSKAIYLIWSLCTLTSAIHIHTTGSLESLVSTDRGLMKDPFTSTSQN